MTKNKNSNDTAAPEPTTAITQKHKNTNNASCKTLLSPGMGKVVTWGESDAVVLANLVRAR